MSIPDRVTRLFPGDDGGRARLRRLLLLTAIVAGHLILFAILLLARHAPPPLATGTGLQVFTLSDKPGTPASPSIAKLPKVVVPPPQPSPVAVPVPLPPQTGGGAAGTTAGAEGLVDGGCAVTTAIGHAIEGDPDAVAALLALPPEARSSADAVNLWNGEWLSVAAADGSDALIPIRDIVERALAESSPICVKTALAGPQFIYVKVRDRTVSLVVGSGIWRWDDLRQSNSYDVPPPADAATSPPAEN